MKKLIIILLIAAVFLPACEKRKNDIEMTLPSEPPNLENFRTSDSPQ